MTKRMKAVSISVIGLVVAFFVVNYSLTNVQPGCTLANLTRTPDPQVRSVIQMAETLRKSRFHRKYRQIQTVFQTLRSRLSP